MLTSLLITLCVAVPLMYRRMLCQLKMLTTAIFFRTPVNWYSLKSGAVCRMWQCGYAALSIRGNTFTRGPHVGGNLRLEINEGPLVSCGFPECFRNRSR